MSHMLLGASLGANVVLLLGILGLLLLGHAGFFSSSAPGPTAAAPGASSSLAALSSPTVTPSPTPQMGWLQVSPGSVTLGCSGDQRNQFVILVNTGPQPVQWQENLSLPQDQAGVTASPNHGQLSAGASTPIQIQNQSHGGGDQGAASQQGSISFTPRSTKAGSAPSVSYTTVGC